MLWTGPMSEATTLMVLAGEASGDRRAAELVRALRQCAPERRFVFFGSGGPALRAEGVQMLADIGDTAIIGPLEIARALRRFLDLSREFLRAARERRPRAVILVDWPEFNLHIVKKLKRLGLTTIYYISPQVWAWRRYRVRTIRRYVDRMIVLFPFEVEFYRREGISVDYVGHPLVDSVRATLDRHTFCQKYGLVADRPIVSLLPGSRRTEVEHILPIMIQAIGLISRKMDVQWIVALAPTITREFVRGVLKRSFIEDRGAGDGLSSERFSLTSAGGVRALFLPDDTYNALAHSELAIVTSGTATLESALLGTPLIVVYRTRAINYWLIRPLLRLNTFGMVNLIAGERIAPELIQKDLTVEKLTSVVGELLEDDARRTAMKEKLARLRERLGDGRAAERAARVVLRVIGREQSSATILTTDETA